MRNVKFDCVMRVLPVFCSALRVLRLHCLVAYSGVRRSLTPEDPEQSRARQPVAKHFCAPAVSEFANKPVPEQFRLIRCPLVCHAQRHGISSVRFRQMARGTICSACAGVVSGPVGGFGRMARGVARDEGVSSQDRQEIVPVQVCTRADSICRRDLDLVAVALNLRPFVVSTKNTLMTRQSASG